MNKSLFVLLLIIPLMINCARGQQPIPKDAEIINKKIEPEKILEIEVGAQQIEEYIDLIKGKNIAIIGNQSSLINDTHLVDTLLKLGVSVKKVMSPEHGFRGNVSAGEHIKDGKDSKTNLPIISLYGSHKKPSVRDLEDIDIVIFDLQDVGTRFYTYLSSLHLCMEACAENNKKLIILDRPNPNGYYVDGPILEPKHKSFVGMDPIPIVHGMTLGEYALMLNGEKWLEDSLQCDVVVIKSKNYTHSMSYNLPIKPSPNLPNNISINLYPSLCLFEGTIISIGRGTQRPFQMYGHPSFTKFDTIFTPISIPTASKNPKLKGEECKGYSLVNYTNTEAVNYGKINLSYIINAYNLSGKPKDFFNSFFYKLAGTAELRKQIETGVSEEDIRKGWEAGLNDFKNIRSKYLLYQL